MIEMLCCCCWYRKKTTITKRTNNLLNTKSCCVGLHGRCLRSLESFQVLCRLGKMAESETRKRLKLEVS